MDDPEATSKRSAGASAARRRALRRRRAGALLGVAVMALVVGIVVGTALRGGPHHLNQSRVGAGPLSHGTTAAADRRGSLTLAEREDDAITRTLAYTPYVRMAVRCV